MEEFADIELNKIADKYIEGEPQIAEIPVMPDETNAPKVQGTGVEDVTMTEGTVKFDIRFQAFVPNSEEVISLIINVEAQNDYYPGYPFVKRGIYYCGRMISSQYGMLRNSIRPGTGMHLCNAVYALIAGGDSDIWAGISSNLRLQDIMKRKSPHSILDMAICLQEYYCEYSSITLYMQMAGFILEMMCMHLVRPQRYYGVLMSDKEMKILDTFTDADIDDMFWDPYTCEPSIECYNIVPNDLTYNYMRRIAVTCRDELLLCHAYLNENMNDLEGEYYENY